MKSGMLRLLSLGMLALLLPACGTRDDGTLTPTVAPAIPANVLARAGNQSVTIDWAASGKGARYSVLRSLLPKGPFFPVSVPPQFPLPTRYVDPGLTNGTTYYYQVVSVNAFGSSAPSEVVSGIPGFKAVAVSARLDATNLALLRDGTVWQWGPIQIGGTLESPAQMPNLSDITAISCGMNHSMALASDGRVWSWGSDGFGQLGHQVLGAVLVPDMVVNLTDAIAVASGGWFSLALTHDGIVEAWGTNGEGEFGTGSASPSKSQVPIPVPGLTDIIAIDAGYSHGIALRSDGLVFTWGSNTSGECGRGPASSIPVAVGQVQGLTGIIAISAGYECCLALRSDGTVWAWGDNTYGQLGLGSSSITRATTPTQVVNLSGVTGIAAGGIHSLAVLNDGTMRSWGYNYWGALGNGPPGYNFQYSPVPVLGLTNIVAASASSANSVALGDDGTVYSWGDNSQGELGNGSGSKSHVPVELKNVTGVVGIAAGVNYQYGVPQTSFSLVARTSGTVWGVGLDDQGQLGNGLVLDPPPSDAVQANVLTTATAVAAGYAHALALDANTGAVWGWGANDSGQVGNGTSGTTLLYPVPLATPSGITAIACGPNHSLAIRNDQTLWSWGDNTYLELGRIISGSSALSPGLVPGIGGVVSVSGGLTHSVAVKSDGTVWVWGDNTIGQLGLGTIGGANPTPTQVPGISGAVAAASRYLHTLILLNDGTVLAWGVGDSGQLGNGFPSASEFPLPVLGLTGVTAIAAGIEHSLALKSDGTVVSWGGNLYGELGRVATLSDVPTPVEGLANVVAITSGARHNIALLANGTAWLWGTNEGNQLGVPYVNLSTTPVIISH